MATTSMSLGEHWQEFIRAQVESGRYGSATEVVRDSLRLLEEREQRLAALKEMVAERHCRRPTRGEGIAGFDVDDIMAGARPRATGPARVMRWRLTVLALKDIDAIASYTLAEWGDRQAQRYLADRGTRRFDGLAEAPAWGVDATISAPAYARSRRAAI